MKYNYFLVIQFLILFSEQEKNTYILCVFHEGQFQFIFILSIKFVLFNHIWKLIIICKIKFNVKVSVVYFRFVDLRYVYVFFIFYIKEMDFWRVFDRNQFKNLYYQLFIFFPLPTLRFLFDANNDMYPQNQTVIEIFKLITIKNPSIKSIFFC